jgi:hypothetical protein
MPDENGVGTAVFAATAGGAATYVHGTAVTWATSGWTVWDGSDVNSATGIYGFVYGDDVVTDTTNDVVGVVMTAGEIAYADAKAVNVDGAVAYGTDAQLIAALQSITMRERNLRTVGLTGTPEA